MTFLRGIDPAFVDVVPMNKVQVEELIRQLREALQRSQELSEQMFVNVYVTKGIVQTMNDDIALQYRTSHPDIAFRIELARNIHQRALGRYENQLVMAKAQEKTIGQVFETLTR